MTQLGDEEVWVRDCIRAALPDCAGDQHDDNSQGSMYDLTITYPDGGTGAVEVTAAADAQQLELWKAVRRRGQPWVEPTLTGGWIVEVLPSAKVKDLSRQLPGLLRALEQDSSTVVRGTKTPANRASALAGQLGITQRPRDQPIVPAVSTSCQVGRSGATPRSQATRSPNGSASG